MKKALLLHALLLIAPRLETAKGQAQEQKHPRFVLANEKLLLCRTSDCLTLWDPPQGQAIFPKQIIVDSDQGCIYGFQVLYDKSNSFDDVAAAIDERYAQWAVPNFKTPPMRAWRVEPAKFAISLTVSNKQDEKRQISEAGTVRVIYVAVSGHAVCKDLNQPGN